MPAAGETVPVPLLPGAPWKTVRSGDPDLLDSVFRGHWTLIQQNRDRGAYRVDAVQAPFFVKHYRPPGAAGCVRDFILRRKPQRAYQLAGQLRAAQVSTPRALGLYGVRRGARYEAVLVTEWVQEAESWVPYLLRHTKGGAGRAGVGPALAQLAELIGRMHRLGFYHGDLAGNLLLSGEAVACRSHLIDLEELHPRLTWKRRVKNLEELDRGVLDQHHVSLRGRWEFLRQYGRAAGLETAQCRRLWRDGRAAQLRRIQKAYAAATAESEGSGP